MTKLGTNPRVASQRRQVLVVDDAEVIRTYLKNLLPLKLIATSPLGGEVYAILRHDTRSRTFQLRVDVS